MKRLTAILLALALLAAGVCGCGKEEEKETVIVTEAAEVTEAVTEKAPADNSSDTEATEDNGSVTEATADTAEETGYFSNSDYKDVTKEAADAEIVLSGSEGSISDETRGSSGSTVTITSKGIYHVTGSSDGVMIEVKEEEESGTVYLVLDNVTMENSSACIYVSACDKLVIQCVGENSLTMTGGKDEDIDGAVYSKDDVTVNGTGSLTVTSSLHGIVCSDDLKLTGGTVDITAGSIGLSSKDSIRIADADVTIQSGHDGVQVENNKEDAFVYMESGSLTIEAGYDGIDSTADILVTGGTITVSASDDGITATDTLTIKDGSVTVAKSYEGLEGETVVIDGGTITIYASDDGINAAGGSDTASTSANFGRWGSASTGTLYINGGTVYVNAGGDGLDSNGSLYVTGGTTIVEGPTNNGNGALDIGDGNGCVASITGGTVLAIGSTGMAVNFGSGTQCSALVSLSGDAGTAITVDDGSGFTFTATKSFQCAVYSSPSLTEGKTYNIEAGNVDSTLDFSSGLYYNEIGGFGGFGGQGGNMGRP